MALDQAFRLSSILLAAAAFAALILSGGLLGWLGFLTAAALLVSVLRTLGYRSLDRIASITRLTTTTWNLLLVVAFLGFWADFFWISQDLLPAGVHFLAALLINKLFNLAQRRDFLHLYAISLIAILASAALSSDVWYMLIFLAYLLAAVWTLLLYHLTKETEERPGDSCHTMAIADRTRMGRITARFFWLTNGLAVGSFCLTIVIFFAIPRIGAGFVQKQRGDELRTTGFSEKVDLGVIGSIKQDPSIVMRVQLPDRPREEPGRLYLRGTAYDRYNGHSWSNTLRHRRSLMEMPAGNFVVRTGGPRPRGDVPKALRQDILLESLDTSVLFAAPMADSVTGDFLAVQSDIMGALYLPLPSISRIQYSVWSRPNEVVREDRTAEVLKYPEAVLRHYLQLPNESPRIAELTREIIRDSPTPYQSATAIQDHLLTQYRYSLEMDPERSDRPVEEFLFTRKTGYCEHYATAMVVLLRTAGIPARLVTGFLATEWNGFGNYYTVRQRDAHAWVEAYFPLSGWITMDPTPAQLDGRSELGWHALTRMMDSVKLNWDRLFVRYNAGDQLAVVQGIREGSQTIRRQALDSVTAFLSPISHAVVALAGRLRDTNLAQLGLLALLLGLGLSLLYVLVKRRPWRSYSFTQSWQSPHQRAIARLYDNMLRLVNGRGIHRPPTATPWEFARIVGGHWQDAGDSITLITDLYCKVRFGHAQVSAEELVSMEASLARLRTLVRSPR